MSVMSDMFAVCPPTQRRSLALDGVWVAPTTHLPKSPASEFCTSLIITSPFTFEKAAAIIEDLCCGYDYVLVAIDQPTIVSNPTGSRPVERVASSLIGKLRSGVQPANGGKENFFGDNAPIWTFLSQVGAHQDPMEARTADRGQFLIEVFPALALPALIPIVMQRGSAARYNPSRRRTFSLQDWRLVAGAVKRYADQLSLRDLSAWAAQTMDIANPTKGYQDCLDASICLVIALLWRIEQKPDRLAIAGDGQTDCMVTPVSSCTSEVLCGAARKLNVPILVPSS